MGHFYYVRTSDKLTPSGSAPRTLSSRVMPARPLITVMLLCWGFLSWSQPFLHEGCDSLCVPALLNEDADLIVDCTTPFPDFVLPLAEGCDDAPITAMPSVELDETIVMSYDLTTALGVGADWALWLGGFEAMGHGSSDYFNPTSEGVMLNAYANGTVRITGDLVNDENANEQFHLDLFLKSGQDFESWDAQGRLPKDDLGLGAYVDWTFYEVVDTLSRLEGLGDFEGDMLYLDHMPFSKLFGFQLGADGANNKNTNFGISGWFWYRGMIGGQPVNGTGDVNADLVDGEDDSVSCPVVESRERIVMAWSECGHDVHSYTVERHDLEAPYFETLPPLESADCTSLPDTASIDAFEVGDDCGSDLSLEVLSDAVVGPPCDQELTRTWRLTDACGNYTDTFQVVTLIDTTGPTFILNDVELDCTEWASFEPTTPVITDNCTPSEDIVTSYTEGEPVGAFPSDFTIELSYTATDLCGNATTQSATITVIDTTAPVLTDLPEDVTLTCVEWETYQAQAPSATDNCTDDLGAAQVDTLVVDQACEGTFTLTLTYSFTDLAGNTSSHVQTVNVEDTTPPEVTSSPADLVIDCNDEWPAAEGDNLPTASDDCSGVNITWMDDTTFTECPGELIVRTFTISDNCGNETTVSQNIQKEDTTGPVLEDVPADTTLACGSDLPSAEPTAMDDCSAVDSTWTTVEAIDVAFGTSFSLDFEACALDGLVADGGTISISNDAFDGTCAVEMLHAAGEDPHNFYDPAVLAGRGTYQVMARADGFISDNMVHLLAGDDLGDSGITLSLRPNGTDNPGIDITGLGLNASADAAMAQGEWYSVQVTLGESQLSLSIDGMLVLEVDLPADLPSQGRFKLAAAYAASYDDMSYQAEDPCPVVERYERTFHALDACGNESTATQVIDLIDTVAPVFGELPEDLLIACGEDIPETEVDATDACSDVSILASIDTLIVPCPGTFTLIRTFTAMDACGNAAQHQQTIQVMDDEAPIFLEVPGDVTIQCDEDLPEDLPTSEDACSSPVNVILLAVDSVVGECPQAWLVTRTFQASDACGNTAVTSQLVTIVDTVGPVLVLGLDTVTLECGGDLPTNLPTFGDACDPMVNVAELAPDTVLGACSGEYIVNRHFEAMDACGNTTAYSQAVNYVDTAPPVVEASSVPADVTIQCGTELPSEVPVAGDDCGTVSLSVSVDSVSTDPVCLSALTVTRTFTFTDDCGNASEAAQVITVVDTVAPEFDTSSIPADATFNCTDVHPTCADFDVLAFDDCGTTNVDCQMDTVPTACPGTFTLIMTLVASDDCGNSTDATVTFEVEDTTGPELDLALLPADSTVQCGFVPDVLDSTAFTVSDDCSDWVFGAVRDTTGENDNPCDYQHVDTYTFTDCDGNETVFVHTLTVIDTIGPMMSTAIVEELNFFCPFEVPEYTSPQLASDNDFPFSVTDNCATAEEISISYKDSVLAQNGNDFTVERTWTLTDHCENETDVVQVIIVQEPQLLMPNAFSPGSNGFNDVYVVENLALEEEDGDVYPPCDWSDDPTMVHFMVFNRWGNQVYASPPGARYLNDWQGRSEDNESLVDGTYFVLFRINETRKMGTYVDIRKDQ